MSQRSVKTQSSNIIMFKARAVRPMMESETDETPGHKSPEFMELSESFVSRGAGGRVQSRN